MVAHYNTLQHSEAHTHDSATHCNALQQDIPYSVLLAIGKTMQHTRNTLQHTRNTLQHTRNTTATHTQHTATHTQHTATHTQHTATHTQHTANHTQHTATYCNALQQDSQHLVLLANGNTLQHARNTLQLTRMTLQNPATHCNRTFKTRLC